MENISYSNSYNFDTEYIPTELVSITVFQENDLSHDLWNPSKC